jgi:hypothetical protein
MYDGWSKEAEASSLLISIPVERREEHLSEYTWNQ